jgi:hypothetical protein
MGLLTALGGGFQFESSPAANVRIQDFQEPENGQIDHALDEFDAREQPMAKLVEHCDGSSVKNEGHPNK